MSTYEV